MSAPALVALRGDETDLYERHQPALHRAVTRRVRISCDLVEDACQHAWMQLIRYQPDRGPTLFAWLATVAVREAYSLSELERRTVSLDLPVAGKDDGPSLADALGAPTVIDESLEARRALRALAGLPPRQRRLALLKVAGFSYAEIGAREEASYTTVNAQLVKARRRLRVAREHAA